MFNRRTVLTELRFTLRRLAQTPGFTLTTIFTLALGVGTTVAVLSVVNAILWRPLAVHDSSRLVVIKQPEGVTATREWFESLERRSPRSVHGLAGYRFVQASVVAGGESGLVKAEAFTGDYFRTLGIKPLIGRLPRADDDLAVAVISARFWREWFGADPEAIGSPLTVAGSQLMVVGVVPETFVGLHGGHLLGNAIWVPDRRVTPGSLNVFGRLADGHSLAQASAEFDALSAVERTDRGHRLVTFDIAFSQRPAAFAGVSAIALAMSGLVLVAMAANVLGLFAARQAQHSSVLAIHALLGASQRRLVALVAWEVGLVTLTATILGALIGQAMTGPIGHWSLKLGDALSLQVQPTVDWRVFSWLAVSSTALTVGIVGVLRTRLGQVAVGVVPGLLFGGMATTPRLNETRRRLIGVQVATALVLLITAGLFVRSVSSLYIPKTVPNLGFKAVAWISHEAQGYSTSHIRTVNDALLRQLRLSPEVVNAAVTTVMHGSSRRRVIRARGDGPQAVPVTDVRASPSYFDLLGVAVDEGRIDGDTWTPESGVVALDARAADQLFPGGTAVGRWLALEPESSAARVVAVVSSQLNVDDRMMIFRPIDSARTVAVIVEGRIPAERLVDIVRESFAQLRPPVVPHDVRTLAEQMGSTTGALRSAGTVAGLLGILASVVAVVGIAGTAASLAVRRRREFAIRVALGATNLSIYSLTIREFTRVLLLALVAGLAGAVLAGVSLRPFFRGLRPFDGLSFLLASVGVVVVSIVAVVLPVRRVLSDQPQISLKVF